MALGTWHLARGTWHVATPTYSTRPTSSHARLLHTPDFFTLAEDFEPLYRRVNRYLDIEDRVLILNKRLDIVNDLLDSLSSQVHASYKLTL